MQSKGINRVAQLQRQMIVHLYLYYRRFSSILTDDEWQNKANELAGLDMAGSPYEKEFKDWNGTTGYHLCAIVEDSERLLGLVDWLERYHYERIDNENSGT